jgi:hypothetical protein
MTAATVPKAFVLPAAWIEESLPAEALRELRHSLRSVGRLRGENLFRIAKAAADSAAGMRLSTGSAELLRTAAQDLGGGLPLAVRSSERDEDARTSSSAGAYETVLDVAPVDVPAAVLRCWRSSFSVTALAARARRRGADLIGEMSVLVQRMAPMRCGGVAVSVGSQAVVDVAAGSVDSLVSGRAGAARIERSLSGPAPADAWLAELLRVLLEARRRLHAEAEIEFGVDHAGQLVVLQCRAAGQRLVAALSTGPLRSEPLYEPAARPESLADDDVLTVAREMRAKRMPVFNHARDLGARTSEGWVIRYDSGCSVDDLRDWLSMVGPQVVLDLGPQLRQLVTTPDDAAALLHGVRRGAVSSCVVRPFLPGPTAVVVSMADGGGLKASVGHDGLLALNRGVAAARTLELPADEAAMAAVVGRRAEQTIARVSSELIMGGHARACEWLLDADEAVLVDFARPAATPAAPVGWRGRSDGTPAVIRAPAFILEDQPELIDLSIAPLLSLGQPVPAIDDSALVGIVASLARASTRPVVVASRPYAVLAVLLELVAGFIVEDGSTLSHLGLQAAEAGVPLVVDSRAAGIVADQVIVLRVDGVRTSWSIERENA